MQMRMSRFLLVFGFMFISMINTAQDKPSTLPWAQQQQKLIAPNNERYYGEKVVMSGNTVAVSAMFSKTNNPKSVGAVYIYIQEGASWIQQARLVHPNPALDYVTNFGQAIRLEGDTLVVTALEHDGEEGTDHRVYIFRRYDDVWLFEQQLTGFKSAHLGLSLDRLVVHDIHSTGPYLTDRIHSITVYRHDTDHWVLESTIDVTNLLTHIHSPKLTLYGDTIAILCDLGICIYSYQNGEWLFETSLELPYGGDSPFKRLSSIAMSEDTIVVGHQFDGEISSPKGAIYIYTRTENGWSAAEKFVAVDDTSPVVWFGADLAIDGTTIAANSTWYYEEAHGVGGATYIFERENGVWSQQAKLIAFDSQTVEGDAISSVGLSGEHVIAGLYSVHAVGGAYVFKIPGVEEVEPQTSQLEPHITASTMENGFTTYKVKLKTRPTKEVYLRLKTDGYTLLDNGGIASEQLTLTFNRWNWNKPQSVRLRASNKIAPDGVSTSKLKHLIQKRSAIEYLWVTPPNEKFEIPTDTFAAVAPTADAVVDTLPATFIWNPYPLATKYRIYIKGNGIKYNFDKSVAATKVCTADLCSFTLSSLTKPLPENANLRWRVVAMDVPAKFSKSSGWQTFSTAVPSATLRGN